VVRHVAAGGLASLPGPVQRYLRAVLPEDPPLVTAVDLTHAGTLNMSEGRERWRPFTSRQRVVVPRPGFDWDCRVRLLPGIRLRVRDAYCGGEGILRASLLGIITLANLRGGGELARGELMRFLAEAAWYPTALLPGQGVGWEAVDEGSARATLEDGGNAVGLLFRFDADGLVESVHADARVRTVRGRMVPTPWQGRFWNYAERAGMRVPLEGEVAWVLPDGLKPYWRGRITSLRYEYT